MAISLPKGTKEFLVVIVVDRLNNIDDLENADDVKFDVTTLDDDPVITDGDPQLDGMSALCLVDTSDMDEGDHLLYLKVDITPQNIVLGPFRFYVDSVANA